MYPNPESTTVVGATNSLWILFVDTDSHTLNCNAFHTFIQGTSRMRCAPRLHLVSLGIQVGKKCRGMLRRFDKDLGVLKIVATAQGWYTTIQDHSGNTASCLVWHTGTIAIAMGRVSIRRGIGCPIVKILNRHYIFLPFQGHVVSHYMFRVGKETTGDSCNVRSSSPPLEWLDEARW